MPVRVLHVIPSLGRGGAERQLVNVVSNTDRREFEHTVCHLRAPDDFSADIHRAGHRVVELGAAARRPWLNAARRLTPLLRSHVPDLVHTWLYDASVSARLAQLVVRGIPQVTSLQNPDYEPETIRAANWPRVKVEALRWQDKISAWWARPTFVACSHFVARSATRWLGIPGSRMRIIYNSVDPESLLCSPEAPRYLRRSLGIPEDGIVFINVARLDPQKGQAYLLRALQRVLADAPSAYLVIVGEGPLAVDLNRLAVELGISERVRFLGVRTDVGACLQMADVFVFPTFFEGFGIALIEAMCQALPCIASRVGPLPELVTDGETGVLVAPGSVEDLAAAMLNLYSNSGHRSDLGAKGQRDALARFQSSVTIPQWEALYHEVVREAASPRNGDGKPLD